MGSEMCIRDRLSCEGSGFGRVCSLIPFACLGKVDFYQVIYEVGVLEAVLKFH